MSIKSIKSKINDKICVPVIGLTLTEFLDNLITIQEQHNFVELRLDYICDLETKDLLKIKKILTVKSITTCRPNWEGGFYNKSEIERIEILKKCLELGFDYVDIELKTAMSNCTKIINKKDKPKKKKNQALQDQVEKPNPPTLDLNKKHTDTKIILSYHNFQKTDNYRNLRQIQTRMQGFGCDIKKIACMITKPEDNIILTRLLTNKTKSEEIIVLGMGENSKFMRLNTILLGGFLTFATIGNHKTASGQMTLEEVRNALS